MAASLLSSEILNLDNLPDLMDINSLSELLENMGSKITKGQNSISVDNSDISSTLAPYDIVRKMRASVLVLGPLLAKYGSATVSLPGGCAIGTRPVDMHINALEEMGASIEIKEGYIYAKAPKEGLRGAEIVFPQKSVGATENILMAATLANGTTTIANAAKEPEIEDLAKCLIQMGAKIEGIGTDLLTITGVKNLKSTNYSVIADRIETGTYMIAVAMTGGEVIFKNTRLDFLSALLPILKMAGIDIVELKNGDIKVTRNKNKPLNAVDITTKPYPGFPTDLQAQIMAMLTIADGAAVVDETIFENRFMHVPELARMGADITIKGSSALVRGVKELKGAEVMATDLRASVSLILAGLVANGTTIVNRIYHLDRGYEKLEEKLGACGAKLTRIS